ncbi:MAG: hypothetical protein LAO31_06270 [Acidobacteriia bacterium]|nr:hypothetical protein [Terriglobia bacterium]
MNAQLRQRLLEMVEEERRIHTELTAAGEIFQGYAPRLAEVDLRKALELEKIIEEHGWPGRSLVGEDRAHAAWFTLQHAIGHPELQRRCLPVLKEAVTRGESTPAQAAFLEDKICFFERRPQRYGTQFDWDENGVMSPWVLENPGRVDEYRRSVGLSPLAEKIEQFRRESKDEPKPLDFKTRQEEVLTWAKSVGWV